MHNRKRGLDDEDLLLEIPFYLRGTILPQNKSVRKDELSQKGAEQVGEEGEECPHYKEEYEQE